MPQFDPTYFASQVFWLFVTFAIFFIILLKVVLPRITDVMDSREQKVAGDLDRAEKAKAEAEDVMQAYEAALAKSRAEAQELVRQESEALSAAQAARISAFEESLSAKMDEAEKRIEATRAEALSNVREVASELTGVVVQKMIGGNKPAAKTIQDALDQA